METSKLGVRVLNLASVLFALILAQFDIFRDGGWRIFLSGCFITAIFNQVLVPFPKVCFDAMYQKQLSYSQSKWQFCNRGATIKYYIIGQIKKPQGFNEKCQ